MPSFALEGSIDRKDRRSAPFLAAVGPPQENRRDVHDWQPLETAPVGEPVLVQVRGRDAPVVAIRDKDGDWQATWNGDLIMDPLRWAPIRIGFKAREE
jgi:hypothetical protein